MATVITKTVKPSGGDYTLVSAAYADAPASLVAADEQWDILCDTFSGGVSDGFDTTTKTSDATRFIRIAAAAGHEYNQWDDSGFFMTASRNFDGVITNTTTTFLRLENIGLKNTGTSSARGITSSVDDIALSGVYATTAATQPCFNISSGVRVLLEFCIGEGGATCLATGSFTGGDVNNLTGVDNTNGYSKGGASRALILTNSLYIGSGAFISGTNNFDASSDYNAGSDTTAPGSNSLDNRTTADFADYAGSDYRTASASALATAGDGVTSAFIGFELEASSGITITPDSGSYSLSGTDVTLKASRKDIASSGSYLLSGTSANLISSLSITTTSGSYLLTGSDVNLLAANKLLSESGNYTLTGTDVTLIYTPVGGDTITVDSGTYLLSGDEVILKSEFNLVANSGNYSISGTNVPLRYNALIHVDSGFYQYNGTSLNLNADYAIIAQSDSYTLNGTAVTLRWSGDTSQTIGVVTAGFAPDKYSVSYKPNSITVNFKD